MNIACQYVKLKTLEPVSGDRINEINLMKALSRFSEVYFAGQPFLPNEGNYGLQNYDGGHTRVDTDITYLRSAPWMMSSATGKKLVFAAPYHRTMFEQADYLVTLTEEWARKLRAGEVFQYNPDGIAWPNVLVFRQTLGEQFNGNYWMRNSMIRLGMVGKFREYNRPDIIIDNMQYFEKEFPGITFVFIENEPYERMPELIRSCDAVVLTQSGPDWDWVGNIKPLEVMACGVPVIMERSIAREESFGQNYPLFLNRGAIQEKLISHIAHMIWTSLRYPDEWRKHMSDKILYRHHINNTSKYLQTILTDIL